MDLTLGHEKRLHNNFIGGMLIFWHQPAEKSEGFAGLPTLNT